MSIQPHNESAEMTTENLHRMWLPGVHLNMIAAALAIGSVIWAVGATTWPSGSLVLLQAMLVTFAWLAAALAFPLLLEVHPVGLSLVYIWGRERLEWPTIVGLKRQRPLGLREFRLLLRTGGSIGLGFLGHHKERAIENLISEKRGGV